METVQPLINQWQQRLMGALSAPNPNMLAVRNLADTANPMYHLLTAGMAGERLPSEIARNMAEASRPAIVPNVFSGPGGQVSSFMVPPGGRPEAFASGVHPTTGQFKPEEYVMKTLWDVNKRVAEARKDPFLMSDPAKLEAEINTIHEEGRNLINMIPGLFRGGATTTSPAAGITWDAYYKAAKAKNPGATDDFILKQYQKEVGGR